MNAQTPDPDEDVLQKSENFSFVLGGPLFQTLCRAHLSDDALALVHRRILVISLFAWLPLLVLSAAEGDALGGRVAIPFLLDIDVQIRFLVVVPLLIGTEVLVHRRMRLAVRQFLDRQLIPAESVKRFDAALDSSIRLRNSTLAEMLLIALVYGVGILIVWRQHGALHMATWYGTPSVTGRKLSFAGMWYGTVSLPFFQFLICRWYFRLGVWAHFLWKVSRIRLNLIPAHPDGNAGLGFLSNTAYAFRLFAAAHGAMLAGLIANRIFYLGAKLTDFKAEIAVLVIFLLCVIFGPLLVFASQIAQAYRTGYLQYGVLAMRYVRAFDTKWLHGGAPADEPLIGSADIQSLADLNNSLQVIRDMSMVPVTMDAIIQLLAATLLPIVPLVLTIMPLEEVMNRLLGMLI
ncbi:MAG TPA: hypothetical protein VMH92_10780 [Acidocella sp.]|nr:hypothetical protein [Acidocella sp.]